MLGAIAGDIIGSVHEFLGTKTKDFPLFVPESRFTDDTVLTVAVAECLLTGCSYVDRFHEYTRAYPGRCYGVGFWHWVNSGSRVPYNSWGNSSAMRVSPVGFAFEALEEVLTGRNSRSTSDGRRRISCSAGRIQAGNSDGDPKEIRLRSQPNSATDSSDIQVQ